MTYVVLYKLTRVHFNMSHIKMQVFGVALFLSWSVVNATSFAFTSSEVLLDSHTVVVMGKDDFEIIPTYPDALYIHHHVVGYLVSETTLVQLNVTFEVSELSILFGEVSVNSRLRVGMTPTTSFPVTSLGLVPAVMGTVETGTFLTGMVDMSLPLPPHSYLVLTVYITSTSRVDEIMGRVNAICTVL